MALAKLESSDIVIGSRNSRDASGAEQLVPQSMLKRAMGISGNKLIKLLTKTKINDTQCGFKVMNRKFVDSIIPKTKCKRWALDIELILLANKYRHEIGIIPIKWTCGPVSRVGMKGYFIMLGELGWIWWRNLRGRY